MPGAWDTGSSINTVFILASNFKNIAIFKNKKLRGLTNVPVCIVWYSCVGKENNLLRVSGNVWNYYAQVNPYQYQVK